MHKSATVEKVAIFVAAGLDLCTSSNCLADSDGFSTGANSTGRRNAVWVSEADWQCPWHGHPGGSFLVTEALSQRRLTGFDVSDNAGHGE